MNRKKLAVIILSVALFLTLADALFTNYLFAQQRAWFNQGLIDSLPNLELNPLLKSIAGTPWLIVVKVGWVLVFLIGILFVKKDYRIKFGKVA